jgi:hypothetical protein
MIVPPPVIVPKLDSDYAGTPINDPINLIFSVLIILNGIVFLIQFFKERKRQLSSQATQEFYLMLALLFLGFGITTACVFITARLI